MSDKTYCSRTTDVVVVTVELGNVTGSSSLTARGATGAGGPSTTSSRRRLTI